MKNEGHDQNIQDKLNDLAVLIERVQAFNTLIKDYIDFKEFKYEDLTKNDNALLVLNELNRTKQEHILLNCQIDELLNTALTKIEETITLIK